MKSATFFLELMIQIKLNDCFGSTLAETETKREYMFLLAQVNMGLTDVTKYYDYSDSLELVSLFLHSKDKNVFHSFLNKINEI